MRYHGYAYLNDVLKGIDVISLCLDEFTHDKQQRPEGISQFVVSFSLSLNTTIPKIVYMYSYNIMGWQRKSFIKTKFTAEENNTNSLLSFEHTIN